MSIVIGVDAGGTRTVAAIARGNDAPSTYVVAGANPNVYGIPAAADTIATAIATALNGDAPDAIAIGAAGAGLVETADALQRALQARFPAAHVAVTHDLRIALRAAVPYGDGAVLVAGTGSAAYAEIGDQTLLAGGGGFAYGDEGSGYAIGAAALRLLRRCFEGRARHDALLDALVAQTGARTTSELNAHVYGAASPIAAVAAVAATTIESADAGDRSAMKIVQAAALDLYGLACAVCRSLETESGQFPLAFSGGLLARNSILTYLIETRIANELPHVTVLKNAGEPYLGALTMARALLVSP